METQVKNLFCSYLLAGRTAALARLEMRSSLPTEFHPLIDSIVEQWDAFVKPSPQPADN